MSTTIPLEEGWATLDAGLRRAEGLIFDGKISPDEYSRQISTDEYSTLYTTTLTMCTQKPPNNWSDDLYQRVRTEAQQFSARAVARLAGKQGDQYVAALFGVWRGFELYARYATSVFKYLDRYYVERLRVPGIHEVLAEAFSGALDLEASYTIVAPWADAQISELPRHALERLVRESRDSGTPITVDAIVALSTGTVGRDRDIALLRFVQARISMPAEQRNGPLEEKWRACCAAHRDLLAMARRRRALALMYVLCAKAPPRAELGDDSGRLSSLVVRLAREGPFERNVPPGQVPRSPPMDLILEKVTEQYASELVRPVEALLEATAAAAAAGAE